MMAYIRLLRPADWIKNAFVFAALAFGNKMGDLHAIRLALVAFSVFCLASSAGYISNDLLDPERDRHHPVKKFRALASGEVSPSAAVAVMVIILVVAAVMSYTTLPHKFAWTALAYVVLS